MIDHPALSQYELLTTAGRALMIVDELLNLIDNEDLTTDLGSEERERIRDLDSKRDELVRVYDRYRIGA